MSDAPEKHEIWEVQIQGTVWVQVYEPSTRKYRLVPLSKKGTRRIQLTVEEREHNQAMIDYERQDKDPFANGVLAQIIDGKPQGVVTDADLAERLEIRGDAFREAIEDLIPNEMLLRRLKDIAKTDGTRAQYDIVRELVEEHYKVGGTQRTVQEMYDAGEKLTGTVLH